MQGSLRPLGGVAQAVGPARRDGSKRCTARRSRKSQEGKEPPPPCEECQGIGYKGRTAIFELLVVNDAVREALLKTPKLELVRTAARKAGMRTLQEEGILLVAKGVTSVAELSRILKT